MKTWFQVLPGEETGRQKLVRILREVAAKHEMAPGLVRSENCWRAVAVARQEFMWRARKETRFSLPQIGAFIGRDHTTVLHGIRRHEERIAA